MPSAHSFDGQAFFDAADKRRRERQLSWPALATVIWEQSRALNERRNDHPISPATIRKAAGGLSCQHALFVLRWLGLPPEAFIAVPQPGTAGVPLPLADEAHRLRWDLKKLHGALNAARTGRGATWQQAAARLYCTQNQLTGLRNAKFATRCDLRCGLPRRCIAQRLTSSMSRSGSTSVTISAIQLLHERTPNGFTILG
ncbi:MAG: hypothetical protein WCA50_15385 [Candidatus Sulfotelmatobacter sp.]